MVTFDNIIKEINNLPVNRLEEAYKLIHSLTPMAKPNEAVNKKILSFSGAFSDMSDKDYAEYLEETKKQRKNLFNREVDI